MVGGRLADHLGRKRMLIITTIWFSVFSLANALVWDPVGLFIARLLTGIGLSAMTAIGITYVVEMFPAASRGRYHALVVMVGLLGIPATAYVARYVVPMGHWGWRLVFIWGALGLVFGKVLEDLVGGLVGEGFPESKNGLAHDEGAVGFRVTGRLQGLGGLVDPVGLGCIEGDRDDAISRLLPSLGNEARYPRGTDRLSCALDEPLLLTCHRP